MYIIGLTGGIASGKSTVSVILKEELGAFIIDADELARTVTDKGKPAYEDIVSKFGRDILTTEGHIDRKKLGQIIFSDREARKELESITHPQIWQEAQKLISKAEKEGRKIAVLDAALLIEAGLTAKVNQVWLVYTDKPTQINRLMKRDNLSLPEAMARINAQLSLEEKLKYAGVVIDNSGNPENTKEQVISFYRATYSLIEKQ